MRSIRYPKREDWGAILRRPAAEAAQVDETVRSIIAAVRREGDGAIRRFARTYDEVGMQDLAVCSKEFADAEQRISKELAGAIRLAHANIETFHSFESESFEPVETAPGITCWRRSVPIGRVGLYVPSGTAPLFSTVLMLGVPAVLAGCPDIVICTPPSKDGRAADAILYAAKVCGITNVYKLGGAQAIAAMAYGTETIPSVDKIFGPGNSFVTTAKQFVSKDVAIDMPAGPSELAVLADEACNAVFVAADLLSQAEHGSDSQVILVSDSEKVIGEILAEVERQLTDLPRRAIAERALLNSSAILVRDLYEGVELLNEYAAEHLILAVRDPEAAADRVVCAGSVFLGNYSCESAGDYASGPNHTLPTGGFARSYSGVSVDSFVKKITFQKLTPEGIGAIGPAVEVMASAEGLDAHRRAISVRLEALNGV